MSETKFTPGPWQPRYTGRGKSVFYHVSVTVPVIPGYCGETTKELASMSTTDGESERFNAYLIAAAPELYDALENMLAISGGVERGSAVYDSAVAALAKARGES